MSPIFSRSAIHFNVIVVSGRNRPENFHFPPIPFSVSSPVCFIPPETETLFTHS